MLELSGPLKGKVYTQEVVTSEEFARLFDCPANKKGEDAHILELCPHLITVDVAGQVNYLRSITQKCEYQVNVDGDLVTVRYYRTKNQIALGQYKYAPDNLVFEGRSNAYNPKDYEVFLFMYASPICKNSISASADPMIQYHDPAALELAAEQKADRFARMVEIIQSAPATDVIAKSRGISIRGEGTGVSQTAGIGLHRHALIGLLSKYQDEFEAAWESDTVFVRGLAREAMYKGAVKQQTIGNRNAWVWGSNNTTILFIPAGADAFTELITWCLSPENYEYAKGALVREVSGLGQKPIELHPGTPPEAPAGQAISEVRAMINTGIEKGLVWREEETNRIFYQGAQGPVETRACSDADWAANLEKFLNMPGHQNHKAAVKAAINN